MAERPVEINLADWIQTSDSPLNSDDSYGSTTEGFGDLTIGSHGDNNHDSNGGGGQEEEVEIKPDEGTRREIYDSDEANEILKRLAAKFDDINTTTKSRYRFKMLTELSQEEILSEPVIIKDTNTCVVWPCHVIGDIWFKTKVYFGRNCKLPCCQEYALPHEMARQRRFIISKRHYLSDTCVSPKETDAVLRWADLVRSQEWKDGQWNERGFLHMKDTKMFPTERVSWSAMEEHLITLAYSKKPQLVFLAARICMETLAKNRGLYNYPNQYWGFARTCTDLLKYDYPQIQEGILRSLQLYLRTLKIFNACFTNKCSEWASAGLFPVLMDMLDKQGENGAQMSAEIKAVIVNILVLMVTHAAYINLAVNMGFLDPLAAMATTQSILLKRRVFGCLEIFAKNVSVQPAMIKTELLPLIVRQLSLNDKPMTFSCLLTLIAVCQDYETLVKILEVDNKLIVKAVIRLLSEEDDKVLPTGKNNVMDAQTQSWCSITRQSLILASRLCVEGSACEMMVKRGLIKKLKELWADSESITERNLILEVLSVASRHHKPADKLCRENFLLILTDAILDHVYHEPVLQITLYLGKKHGDALMNCGLLPEIIKAFGDKAIHRKYFSLILNICATFCSNEKVQRLILSNQARAYMLILDIAFTTNDFTTLKSCVSILAKFDSHHVPTQVLRNNILLLVAYIDKLLKTGHDDLILHGLMQLQDLLQVDFLHGSFKEHHTQRVVELLCSAPYPAPIQMIARQVVSALSGQRSRHSSTSYDFKKKEEEEVDSDKDKSVKSEQITDSTVYLSGDDSNIEEADEVNADVSGDCEIVDEKDSVNDNDDFEMVDNDDNIKV